MIDILDDDDSFHDLERNYQNNFHVPNGDLKQQQEL